MNTFGTLFRFTTFGESHGPAIGGVIDGMPAGIAIDLDEVQRELARRRPGQGPGATARREPDCLKVLSGLSGGRTLGTPIGFVIENTDVRSADYGAMADKLRPNHADFTYMARYGTMPQPGGGRASARETACRVVAGAFAKQALLLRGVSVTAVVAEIGGATDEAEMMRLIDECKRQGDTLGGIVTMTATGVPAGVGEPLYNKLSAALGAAMLSINAAKGVEIGDGFGLARARGSEVVDPFNATADGQIYTTANHSGGIQGGISNGAPIVVRVAFKPVPTMMRPLETVTVDGRNAVIEPRGRHDVCVVARAVPVVEAMAACVILDQMLMSGK